MNARTKGKVGEREAAKEIQRVLRVSMRRGVQHAGGPESPDVVGLDGVHLEVKRVQSLNLESAMNQAVRDCGGGSVPVVMHRKNNRPWLWTFRFDDVLRLVDALNAAIDEGHKATMPIPDATLPNQAGLSSNLLGDMGFAVERAESKPSANRDNVAAGGSAHD